jgi:hypothetical protein
MNLKIALPLFVLLPGGCAQTARPHPLPALAEQRQCPAYPLPAGRTAEGDDEDGLSRPDKLTATEQAIQLDELIKWCRRKRAVAPSNDLAAEAEAGGGAERVAAPRSVGNGIGIALLGAYLAVW